MCVQSDPDSSTDTRAISHCGRRELHSRIVPRARGCDGGQEQGQSTRLTCDAAWVGCCIATSDLPLQIETVVWRLFQTLDSATENTRQNFDASAMTTNVAALVSGPTASFASDSLLVIRSCILLHFCLNVVLVIVNTQGEDGEDEEAEDAAATPPSMLAP